MRGALATIAAASALLAGTAGASGSTTLHLQPRGFVPHTAQQGPLTHALAKAHSFAVPGLLTFDANYETLINGYFADVAADSTLDTNVYSLAEQYSSIQYQSAVGGSYVDHHPLPPNGCDDGQDAVCLTDSQLQAEIQNVLTTKGWHGSSTNMFFLMTPSGVGSCVDSSGTECTTNVFCAYHSAFTDSQSETVIYANQPYDAAIPGCDSGESPNGDDADAELNTISHEHNEAITDPLGNAWYTSDFAENGDLCAWTFGTPSGSAGAEYNQVINAHHYWLQQEFSNADNGCLQKAGGTVTVAPPLNGTPPLLYHGGPVMHTNTTYAIYWLPTPGNTSAPAVAGTAAVNHTLTTSTGSWNGSPTGFAYQWQRCSSGGTGCVDIPSATASGYALTSADGGKTVRSTVRATNPNGTSQPAASATSGVVVPLPAASAAPAVSGVAAVGKALATTKGTWNTAVSVTYRWERCATDGTGCGAVTGATSNTYAVDTADAGHTLRSVVTATNAAGTTSGTSAATAIVVDLPRATSAPHILGKAKVGKRLSASPGAWTYSPTAFRYQWLRCSRSGAGCVAIRHATGTAYRITRRDLRHRLRLRVVATNPAGRGSSTSSPTARVIR